MKVSAFEGIPSIQEISCSGEALESDVTVFAMVLLQDSRQLAQVNIMAKECTTSGAFSSCVLHETNSRRTTLKTLVMDLGATETRMYVCEVTFLRSGEKTKSSTWTLEVQGWREYFIWFVVVVFLCLSVCLSICLVCVSMCLCVGVC